MDLRTGTSPMAGTAGDLLLDAVEAAGVASDLRVELSLRRDAANVFTTRPRLNGLLQPTVDPFDPVTYHSKALTAHGRLTAAVRGR